MTEIKQKEALKSTTKEKTYNLKNDVIFQTFFARKGNEEFLIDFLNGLLKKDIKSIEMQLRNEYNIEERTTLYSGKVMSRETERGTDYDDIKQVIMINILGFNFLDVDDYISETAIVLEKHREYEVLTGIKWYFIELPKFRKQNPDMNEKINQWLAFIDDYDREMVKVAEEKNDKLKKARIEMNYLTGEAETRRLAELREKWEMDRVSAINHATRKGKKEKSMEIAKKLLKLNMPLEQIIEITELTKEEIEKIKNK